MNDVRDGNHLAIFEEYEFDKPLIRKKDFIIDKCIGDCHDRYFLTFEYKRAYDIKVTNLSNNELVNLPIVDGSMILYELKKKIKKCSTKSFLFFQIKNFENTVL